ncbi:divalent-cation tolerance protein CutA [Sphingomonas sp. 3-13AW]|jgi:periplasmic divalent cation tolerance protein|uniref:divalent-cation tolerance protein CutA n=1 Tax=Sphingomonas sp. 3-13AW TaxID=3050450 RepID=UPI003BB7EFDF
MSDITLLQATFAGAEEAERIGRLMVEEGLAACVNVLASCTSIYRWKDAIETEIEVTALFKTRPELAEALAARIGELHSYELPAIEWWGVETTPEVAEWVAEQTVGEQA